MNILTQLTLFFFISFISEIISSLLPFTFPASVLSMIILFLLLLKKIIKLEHIEEVGTFLQKNMSLFFIPPAISIIDEFSLFQDKIFQIIFISFISFLITFLSTILTVNLVIKLQIKFRKNKG